MSGSDTRLKMMLSSGPHLAVALERGARPSAAEARWGRRGAGCPLGREVGRAGTGWAAARRRGKGKEMRAAGGGKKGLGQAQVG